MAGFNGSGTFSRVYSSWVADRIAGTPITDTRMDDEFSGFVTGLTTTICRDGQSTTTARIPFAAGANVMTGAAAAVGLSITGDVGTGLWSSGATTNLSIAVAGTTRLSAGTAGVAVTGTLSSSGVFTGTTTAVFGANSGTGGAVKLYGATSGDATIKVAAAAGTSTIFQVPASNGTSGYVLTTDGSGVTSWLNPASIAGDLDVGTTAIVGGTTTRILYNNAGVLGEYTLSGTGTIVAMTAGPTFTGTIAGAALTLSTPLGAASGGTGVANNAASTLTISGNFATTLTVSATTGVTLPTTGTLATLAGTETFTNKTLTTAILNGTVTGTSQATANTASTLVMRDASGNFAAGTITANLTGNASGTALTVTQAAQTAITSLGTLTGLTMGGTLAMGSNALTSTGTMTSGVHTLAAAGPQIILGANTTVLGSVKMFGSTSGDATLQPAAVAGTATAITLPAVTGTLATLAGTETFTNKTLTTAILNGTITGTSQATANTASTLVMRDASGNFSAGTITTSTLAATTINAFTLGGTVAGGGNQINNVIIGTSTPLAGSFTTIAGSGIISLTNTTEASDLTTASVVLAGGLSVAKKIFVGDHVDLQNGKLAVWRAPDGSANPTYNFATGQSTYLSLITTFNGATVTTLTNVGDLTLAASTTASSTAAAALVVTGGVGIGDNLRVANGGTFSGNLLVNATGSAPNFRVTNTGQDTTAVFGGTGGNGGSDPRWYQYLSLNNGQTPFSASDRSYIFSQYSDNTLHLRYYNGSTYADELVTVFSTGGVTIASPTGGDKGSGTLNAVGVYDDNVLLTDYVFDKFMGRTATYSPRVQAKADELDPGMYKVKAFSGFWREHGRLYGMPDLNDCIDGIVKDYSLGAMIQKHSQVIELQAIHIDSHEQQIDDLTAELAAVKSELARLKGAHHA